MDVAIVGMACRFPGSSDLASFWANVLDGRDCISDVPADRWDPDEFCDPQASLTDNDRVPSRRGGYLDTPLPFDPTAFGIPPVAVEGGEPEQFLVLEAAWKALQDAGLPQGIPDGRRVEVVIGRGNYFNRGNLTRLQHGRIVAQTLQVLRALHPDWSEADFEAIRRDLKASLPPFGADTISGQITNATAGRLANRLNFRGANFVVDAASASALVALDLGARALIEKRADLAIIDAVYVQPDVDFPMVFNQLGALSPSGRNRPFAKEADGLVPGEGVGVIVLKRLADAERDGHRVYAVLKGVGLASDGRGPSLAKPDPRGHTLAIRRAYRRSGIEPGLVGLIEGHGLGVPAADLAELSALRKVFPPSQRRAIGAVSSMIGHAMPAAGMAGLIKSALALHHRLLPPTLIEGSPHPLLNDEKSPARLNQKARPWVHGHPSHERSAGVNAFGFSGISAHAVLAEHRVSADALTSPGALLDWDSEAILLGANDRQEWLRLADALLDWLDSEPNATLKDLAFTINVGQPRFPFRVGLVARSLEDLAVRLRDVKKRLANPDCHSIRDVRGAYYWSEPLAGPGRLAFVFPGEGSQYAGMLADLYPHFPEIRQPFDRADRVALDRGQPILPSEILFGSGHPTGSDLWGMSTAVSVVLSAQWGLYLLLRRLGLRPDVVAGHSSGEILALGAAGVLRVDRRFEDRLARMGDLFEQLEVNGDVPKAELLAIAADRERVEALCQNLGVSATVAMDNCPHQVVLAVEAGQGSTLMEQLRGHGLACETLPFARAYHTPAFTKALEPLRQFYGEIPLERPRVPLYSCATASRMPDDPEAIRKLAIEQWARPVAFRSMIETLHEDGARLFVEVGARGNLTGFIEDTIRGRPGFAIAANLPRRSGLTQLNHLVASLFAQGESVRPDHLYLRRRPERLDLSERPKPRPEPQSLALGFPSMRLSESLAASLRERSANSAVESAHRPQTSPTSPLPAGETDEAMLAYLRTMEEFAQVQQEVMAAYLNRSAGSPQSPNMAPASKSAAPEEITKPEPPTIPGPSPAPEANESVESILLAKVSARTGYPLEMLGLDLDLEADLGIDSIKRVEILGDLQSLGVVPRTVDLDALGHARTLRHWLEHLQAAPPLNANETQAGPWSETQAGPWVGEIRSLLSGSEVVLERRLDPGEDPIAEHHTLGGRRVSTIDPERKGLPVVPFAVMVEMLAEAAALLVPGRPLVAVREIAAHRWIPYEADPVILEIRGERDPSQPDQVRVRIQNRGPAGASSRTKNEGPVVEGTIVFGDARPEAPPAGPFSLEDAGPSRFTAESLYGEGWLFHGPPLQGVSRVGPSAPLGIEGGLRVLPHDPILPEGRADDLLIDPIVLDSFTHLLGCWGLDQLAEGEVVFPWRLAELAIFGERPPEGTELSCRIQVVEIERHRVRADAEIVRPDGRVWLRLQGWEDWRFYWPNRYRDQFRMPDQILLGERLEEPTLLGDLAVVWLEPPSDFARPVWRDVMEAVQLSPEERTILTSQGGPQKRRALRIWGRVAAKEAIRRLWLDQGASTVFPSDLSIEPDRYGRPQLRAWPKELPEPSVSISHTEGLAVALAILAPNAAIGIDVERIVDREAGFERIAFSEGERAILDQIVAERGSRSEWVARLWCAKEAAAKATGHGLLVGPASVEIVTHEPGGEDVGVALGPDLRAACPDWTEEPIRVTTSRRGEFAWAWTSGEPRES